MQAILLPIVAWVLREVVVKFIVLAAVYALLVVLVPIAVAFVTPFISTSGLTSVFNALPDGVFFFLYLFKVDFGLPLVISAAIAGFLIRRLPVIG